ncbi:hypothetical protein [Algoriphagus sp. PAP.12]|uniref:hypothetical protein n=1 Tax=Algoriphagus sp. PAP.12 TaxID=2996678 RepID=UPI00227AC233|nr:hypothetical protein [Algoriphagus sp. PAP.12]
MASADTEPEYFPGFFGEYSHDTFGYLEPIDNYLEKGNYLPHERMPGYGLIYGLLLTVLTKTHALNLLIILQSILGGIAVYAIARVAGFITKSQKVFILTFYIALFTTYTTWYDHFLLTESFSVSALVLMVYFYFRYQEIKNPSFIIIAGLFFAWAVFLRAVMLPLGILVVLLMIWEHKEELKNGFKLAFLFLLPFLIVDSLWVYSGYRRFKKFIPLQESFLGRSQSNVFFEPAFRFVQSWGGNYLWWDPGAEISYFGLGHNSLAYFDQKDIQFPSEIFTSAFNQDSLQQLQQDLLSLKFDSAHLSDLEFDLRANSIYARFDRYSQSIKSEAPTLYWFDSRIKLMRQFFFTTKVRNPYYGLSFPFRDRLIRIKSFTYAGTLILGYLSSLIILFFLRENASIILISGIVWYIFLIHPIILRVVENRYLLPSYPFISLSIILASTFVLKKLKFGKALSNSSHSSAQ